MWVGYRGVHRQVRAVVELLEFHIGHHKVGVVIIPTRISPSSDIGVSVCV